MGDLGLSDYQGGEGSRRPGVRQIYEAILKKSAYRAAMELESARISESLPYLNATETQQLAEMLRDEALAADSEVLSLAKTVEREAVLSANIRAMDIKLSREASLALQSQMLREIERNGFCKAPAQLVSDALEIAYGA